MMRTHELSPPILARALLAACLPHGTVKETVLGDLHEVYLDMAESGAAWRPFPARAKLWYWGQAFALGSRYVVRRIAKWRRQRVERAQSYNPNKQPPRDPLMNDFYKDIRFACRLFARNPGFTLASVLVLAIGIGAVTVMFSTLNSVMLQPLPYENPSQLAWVWGSSETRPQNSVSAINYWDYRDEAEAFESMAAVLVFSPRVIITGDEEPERILSTRVSHNFFSVLGISPQIGRGFLPAEELASAPNVVVISDGWWQRQYGGDSEIVGTSVTIGGQPFEVVGVLPSGFDYRADVEMWFPMRRESGFTQGRGNNNFSMFGRLDEGMSMEQAQAQLDTIATRLETNYPETNDGWGVTVESMHEVFVGDARSSLLIMLGLAGLVLLIACANIAALSLARAMVRTTEVAVRFSLGAVRSRVIRQLLTESVLLALAGGVGGLAVAYMGLGALKTMGPANLPRLEAIGVDQTVLMFTFLVSLAASLLFGVVPALRSTRFSLSETLKVGGSRGTSPGRAELRNALVVAQVALSLMLMVASGLLVRSYLRLQDVDPGFEAGHVLQAEIQLPTWRYDTPEAIGNAWQQLHDNLRAIPGVVAVGAVDQAPIRTGGTWNTIYPVERPPSSEAERAQFGAQRRFASDDYFDTLGISILTGRAFEATDQVGSPNVVIISATMAERWFPGENPLGKELFVWDENSQVVGVAEDVREFGLAMDIPPVFYMSSRQVGPDGMQLLIRTVGDPLDLAADLQGTVWEFDSSIPITGLRTMEARISDSLAQPRFRMLLVGLFAGMALVLALVGQYGVLAFFVRQHAHELGIRVALGATPQNVIGLVLGKGMMLVGSGIVLGLLGGFAGVRLIESLLFNVASTDVVTFGGVSLCLIVVALIACIVPAGRAVRIDPQKVLRVE